MPVDIDALEEWTVGDRMLDDMLRGMAPEEARHAEWRRGTLPPGQLGWRKATEIRDQVGAAGRGRPGVTAAPTPTPSTSTSISAVGGSTGTVSPVFGDRLVVGDLLEARRRHLLQSWIPLLALVAHDPSRDWAAVCIGRAKKGTTPQRGAAAQARRSPPSTCCATSSRSTTRAVASRSRCRSRRRTRGRRPCTPTAIPSGRRRYRWKSDTLSRRGRGAGARAGVGPGARSAEHRCDLARSTARHSIGAYAARLWLPMLQATGPRLMDDFDLLGSAARPARSTTVLEASAGHRQDVRAGRSGHAVHRRGRGDARPDAAHHVRPGGQPGAPRPGSAPNRRRGARLSTIRHRAATTSWSRTCSTAARTNAASATTAARRAGRFDAATIATTHQFCQLVLKSLGVAGDTDAGVTLVESLDELVTEIVDDLYLRHFGQRPRRPAAEPRGRAAAGPRGGRATRRRELRPKRPAAGLARRGVRQLRQRRSGRTGSAQAAASASSATTTCSPGSPTRSTPTTHPLSCACISAGRS